MNVYADIEANAKGSLSYDIIEIRPHRWGCKVFEAPGAEPWISGEKSGHLLRGVGPRKAFLRLVLGNDALQLAPDET